MRVFLLILTMICPSIVFAASIECVADQSNMTALVTMHIPHPNYALIHRPNGKTVWLQTSSEFLHEQVKDFSSLAKWEINENSVGTVLSNGKASIEKVLVGKGTYHLYIAENLETEPENTYFMECEFTFQ